MIRRMECGWTGKQIFFSQSDADRTRNHYNKHSRAKDNPLETYRCKKCTWWHHYTKKKREKPDDESVPD